MNAKRLITLMISVAVIGWATVASAADLATVTRNPDQFLNQRIEITAPVVENSALRKGEFKRWTFTVGGADNKLAVYESGFNPATIIEAHGLVEKARKAGDEITVAGKLKDGKSGLVLKLDSVQYGDMKVNTNAGPFTEEYQDCGIGAPQFYDGQKYYLGEFPL